MKRFPAWFLFILTPPPKKTQSRVNIRLPVYTCTRRRLRNIHFHSYSFYVSISEIEYFMSTCICVYLSQENVGFISLSCVEEDIVFHWISSTGTKRCSTTGWITGSPANSGIAGAIKPPLEVSAKGRPHLSTLCFSLLLAEICKLHPAAGIVWSDSH